MLGFRVWRFSKIRGTFLFWGPYNKDNNMFGSVFGSPVSGNYHMSYSLVSLNGGVIQWTIQGCIIGIIKRDTRSFDYSSYEVDKALIYLQSSLVVPITG